MTGKDVLDLLDYNLKYFLQNNLKWRELNDIQEKTIPHILNNEDSLIIAPTASGKTEAVLIPVYNQLITTHMEKTSILYIAPLKALINDMDKRLFTWNNYFGISSTKWHGDVNKNIKDKYIRKPTDILLTTPESLEAILINKNEYHKQKIFKNIKYIIIDEIHYFVGSERGIQLNSLLKRLKEYSPNRTVIGLSATVGNEEEVSKWINHDNPANIIKSTDTHKNQFKIQNFTKDSQISEFLSRYISKKILLFAKSRKSVEKYNRLFKDKLNTNTFLHHSSIDKQIRESNEDKFKNIDRAIMTSTNTLELGIDIGNIDIVVFIQPTPTMSSFIQKIGRSGRKSKIHRVLLFSEDHNNSLCYLAQMNLTNKNKVENINLRKKAFDIYLHQILSIVFQKMEVDIKKVYYILNDTYVFSQITKREYKEIVNHLIDNNLLERYGNKISLGSEFENTFGAVNFLNFYSVFSTSTTYKIKYGSKDIGEIDFLYVYNLKKDMSFVLAGNYWQINKINHSKKIICVSKGHKTNNIPRWNSPTEPFTYVIIREIYKIFLNQYDTALLDKFDENFKIFIRYMNNYTKEHNLNENIVPIHYFNGFLTIYTFAGEKVNYLLSYLITNNFIIKDISINSYRIEIKTDKNPQKIIDYYNNLSYNLNDDIKVYIENIEDLEYQTKFGQYLPLEYQKKFITELIFDFENLKELLKTTQAVLIDTDNYEKVTTLLNIDNKHTEEVMEIEDSYDDA